jgi:hypothetical protein
VIGILEAVISGAAVVLSAFILRKVQQVHVLVDGNMTKVLAKLGISEDRAVQLTETLTDAGVDVPDQPGPPA